MEVPEGLAGAEQGATLPCVKGVVSQQEVDPEVFVDASEDTAGGPEGAQCPPSKRTKKETAGCEALDSEQVAGEQFCTSFPSQPVCY